MISNRAKLRNLFADLRSENVVARQNFLCCNSCAMGALEDISKDRGKDGFVFFHKQDGSLAEKKGYIMIGFSADQEDRIKEIGAMICEKAEKAELKAIWNGDISMKVEIEFA